VAAPRWVAREGFTGPTAEHDALEAAQAFERRGALAVDVEAGWLDARAFALFEAAPPGARDGWRLPPAEIPDLPPLAGPITVGGVRVASAGAPDLAARRLVLDAGSAFGSGLHPTTAMMLDRLADHASPDRSAEVLDVGTGTGVLALAALARGFARATGVDIHAPARAAARAHAARHGVRDRLEVRAALPEGRVYPLVLANIRAHVLRTLAADLAARLAAGGALLVSGVRFHELDPVEAALGAQGLVPTRRGLAGGFWCVTLGRAGFPARAAELVS
jgi:SAM-dependent methyltransferase